MSDDRQTTFHYCTKCGSMVFGRRELSADKANCTKCDFPRKSIEYTGRYNGEYAIIEDMQKQQQQIIESVKSSPDFDQFLYDKQVREDKEFWDNVKNRNNEVKCPKCGSTNITAVPRKWSLLTGFFTNKVDRFCISCKCKF